MEQNNLLTKASTEFISKKFSRDTTSRYALLNADGSVNWDMPEYCHAGLRRCPPKDDPIAVLNQVQGFRAGEDVATRFLEWLLNYSPYRDVFTTKNVKEILETNLVVADTENVDANLMVSALMSQRACSENYSGNRNFSIANTWDRLVQLGVHPSLAFAASHWFRPDEKLSTISLYARTHHTGIGSDAVSLWNFYDEETTNKIGPYRKAKTYSGTNAVWQKARKHTPVIDIAGAFARTAGVKKGANPFAVQVDGVKSFPYNEALEEVSLTLKNALKEYAIAA